MIRLMLGWTILLVALGSCSATVNPSIISLQKARVNAEQFVIANGYTNLRPTATPESVFTEFWDCTNYGCDDNGQVQDFQKLLNDRRGLLSPRAIGYRNIRGEVEELEDWVWRIYFELIAPDLIVDDLPRYKCVDVDIHGQAWLNEPYCRGSELQEFEK